MKKSKFVKSLAVVLTIQSLFFSPFPINAQTDELPPTKPRSQTRKSGGTRGKCINNKNTITLLVPENQDSSLDVPQTTMSHPTFIWHVKQKSALPIKFTLVEPGRTIYTKEIDVDKSGLVSITLPKNIPPLEVGKEYRWTVSAICSRQNPSQNPYTQAWVKRVSLSSLTEINKKLGCLTYEKAEIWYDALACYLKNNSKINTKRLIEQIDLDYLFDNTSSERNNLNLN